MKTINFQQIAELPDIERQKLKGFTRRVLNKTMRLKAKEQRKTELGVKDESRRRT